MREYVAADSGKVSAKEELRGQFREASSKRIGKEFWDQQHRCDEDHQRRARHDEASQDSKAKPAAKKKSRISKVLDWL